jgi:hypothetical protein
MLRQILTAAALCALASAASSDEAQVNVLDLDGRPLASATLAVPPGGFVPGFAAMSMLHERGTVRWKYTSMGEQPVVTEINGVKSELPRTAWILSTTSKELGSTQFNVGMREVDVRAGDVLLWQLWNIADLPPPAVAEEEEEQEQGQEQEHEHEQDHEGEGYEEEDASYGEDEDYGGGEDDFEEGDNGNEEDEDSAGDEL